MRSRRVWKSVTAILLVLCLACGCGDSQGGDDAVEGGTDEEAATEEPAPQDPHISEDGTVKLYRGELYRLENVSNVVSSNEDVVEASDSGELHGLKKGKAEISATGADGNAVTYTVKVKKAGFMFNEMPIMTTDKLKMNNLFSKDFGKVTWTSGDDAVAKMNKKGTEVTGKAPGETRLTGTDESGEHSFALDVTVEEKPESVVYFTFDDGPSRYTTPKILDILKKNDIKATFFELKPAKADFDLTERLIEEGHTLAMHGYSHTYSEIYKSDEAYHENLLKEQKLFYKKFDKWCTLTRFPGGSSNTVSRHYSKGIMTRLSKELPKWGFKYFDWNVASGDSGGSNNADEVYRSVTSGLQKGRGNVVLMHDFPNNDKSINALQKIIDYAKENGFVFRALNPSNNEVHHGTNN